jgi:hypothetical protein
MIISEVNWNYQKSNTEIYDTLGKRILKRSRLLYNSTKIVTLSFLTSKLCERKLVVIMLGLLLFQFALYDFDFSEYNNLL